MTPDERIQAIYDRLEELAPAFNQFEVNYTPDIHRFADVLNAVGPAEISVPESSRMSLRFDEPVSGEVVNLLYNRLGYDEAEFPSPTEIVMWWD